MLRAPFVLVGLFVSHFLTAQQKQVETQHHSWWSINTLAKVSDKWSLIGDVHIRRNDFLAGNNFYFVRWGISRQMHKGFSLAGGTGHLWLASRNNATELFANENRLYQQAQWVKQNGSIQWVHRIRLEERWQEKIVNGIPIRDRRFTTRMRYLSMLNWSFSKQEYVPKLSIANELLLQTGRDIVYNHFDQNRFFVGFRQKLTSALEADIGYMHVYQQLIQGNKYNENHTFRLFMYWRPDWRKQKEEKSLQLAEAHEF